MTIAEYEARLDALKPKLLEVAELRRQLKEKHRREVSGMTVEQVLTEKPLIPPPPEGVEPQGTAYQRMMATKQLPPTAEETERELTPTPVEGNLGEQLVAVVKNTGKDALQLLAAVPDMAKTAAGGTGEEKIKLAQELIAFAPLHAYHLLNAAGLIPAPLAESLRNMTTDKPIEEAGLSPQQLYDKHKGESQQYVTEHPLATVLGAGGVARMAVPKPSPSVPLPQGEGRTTMVSRETISTPKEVLKTVTPLEEVAAVRERAIAGEPAPERGTNVLIEAEKGAETKQPMQASRSAIESAVKSRGVRGDQLLDAMDLIDELAGKKAEIGSDGMVTLYHRTTPESAAKIVRSGQMISKEDRLFFGTHAEGQIEGYGDAVVKLRLPLEKLELNDVFSNEAHVTLRGTRATVKAEIWTSVDRGKQVAAVTPLEEVAAVRERAIAGEPAPERPANVLVEAEKGTPTGLKYKQTKEDLLIQGYTDSQADYLLRQQGDRASGFADTRSWTPEEVASDAGKHPRLDQADSDATITVYRAVPRGKEINVGDYVFTSKVEADAFVSEYGRKRGQPAIATAQVKKSDLIVPDAGSPTEAIYAPQEGKVAAKEPWEMTLYRGEGLSAKEAGKNRTPSQFAVGKYWTPDKEVAASYGSTVREEVVQLQNPYVWKLPNKRPYFDELKQEFGTKDPNEITKILRSKGYDGLVIENVPVMRRGTDKHLTTEVVVFEDLAAKYGEGAAGTQQGAPTEVPPMKSKRVSKPKTNEEVVADLERLTEEDLARKPGEQPKEVDFEEAESVQNVPSATSHIPVETRRLAKSLMAEAKKKNMSVVDLAQEKGLVKSDMVSMLEDAQKEIRTSTTEAARTKAKGRWEMTKAEYSDYVNQNIAEIEAIVKEKPSLGEGEGSMSYGPNLRRWREVAKDTDARHRELVEQALDFKKPEVPIEDFLPAEVLAEYPDLAAKYGKGEKVAAKEPWEMTADDISVKLNSNTPEKRAFTLTDGNGEMIRGERVGREQPVLKFETREQALAAAEKWHRKEITNALKEGKPVPAEVLADYPDLAAKYGKGEAGTRQGAPTKAKEPWEMTQREYIETSAESVLKEKLDDIAKIESGETVGSLPMGMSPKAYVKNARARYADTSPENLLDVKSYETGHRYKVKDALSNGKPVPAEVLADYPDLAAKYGKGEKVAAKESWEMTKKEAENNFYRVNYITKEGHKGYTIGEFHESAEAAKSAVLANDLEISKVTSVKRIPVEGVWRGTHHSEVESALEKDMPVPAEVLADYPDLAAKYGKGEKVAAKGPWELSQREFVDNTYNEAVKTRPYKNKATWPGGEKNMKTELANSHENEVRMALEQGKPVPPEVLADYPDLAAKYGKGEKVAAKEPWEMTPEEFWNAYPPEAISSKAYDGEVYRHPLADGVFPYKGKAVDAARGKLIKDALEQGKPVPPEVLADYPDLAAKYGKGEAGTQQGAPEKVTKPTVTRLYRGDAQEIEHFSIDKAEELSLFGKGLYFTDRSRIAKDYTLKGGKKVFVTTSGTKQEAIDRYIRQIARNVDESGKELPIGKSYDISYADSPDVKKHLALAREIFEKKKNDLVVRKMADGSVTIQQKDLSRSPTEIDVPTEWVEKALDAEAPVTRDVLEVLDSSLRSVKDKATADEMIAFAKSYESEHGEFPSYRELYTALTSGSDLFTPEGQVILRAKLKRLGFKGIRYEGGKTMGGGKHNAYVFWDEQGIKKLRSGVIKPESVAEAGTRQGAPTEAPIRQEGIPDGAAKQGNRWWIDANDRPVFTDSKNATISGMRGPFTKIEASEMTGTHYDFMDARTVGEPVYTLDVPNPETGLPTTKPRRGTVTERLTMAETDAKIRIRKRNRGGKAFDIGGATAEAVANTADLVIIGAAKMAKGAIEFKEWVVEMLREKPDLKEEHLKAIYEKAKGEFHRIRARGTVKQHIEYYNGISAPPEMRPREYSMLKDIREQLKEDFKEAKPKGKEAKKRIHDLAWQEMLGELWQQGVPMQKLESGELVPLVHLEKPAKEFWNELVAKGEKQFSKEQLKDPAVQREIKEQAREMFVLAAQSRGIATKIKGQQKLRANIRRNPELSLKLMTETVMTAEERVKLRRLNKVDPEQALAEYEKIAKQRGIILPGIRQSGTYVPDEALFYEHFKDAEAGMAGGTKELFRLMEEIDGALPAEVKAKLPGGAGPISKGVLWRNHDMLRQKMAYLYDQEATLKRIKEGLSDKERKFANQVIERIGKDQGNVALENLMTDSRFYEVVTAYKPIAEAIEKARAAGETLSGDVVARIVQEKAGPIVRYAQQMRGWFDEVFADVNAVRSARSQKEIPYHEFYSPHELQQEVFWSKAKHFIEETIKGTKEEVTTPPMPEFIQPNKPFNPRELPRNAGLEEFEREMDLGTLAEHYLDLAAKDMFNTSIIQNAKAYADFLDARGFPNAARAIQELTAEIYAGTPNWLDKRMPKWIIKSLGVYKAGLIRSVFPLNAPWIAVMQTANVVNTTMWHGYLNSAAGLFDWVTKPEWRQQVLDNAYSYMIKSEKGGRAAYQDFDKAMASAARLERKPLEKVQDGFNYFSEQVEKFMTGFAVSAGYRDGAKRGLKGKALWEYASEAGERAQNLFNNEDVPGILRSKTVKGMAPFQTFAFGMMNTMREIAGKTGTPPATAAQRMKIALRFVAGATALNYAWSSINQRKPWDISAWVPFYGVIFGPLVEAGKGEDWKSASSRGLPSPVATGAEGVAAASEAFRTALEDGIWKGKYGKLRKWLMKYGTGLVGIPGGVQMNRIWDGIEAIAKGGVEDASGKMMFPVSGTKESIRAIWSGPYGTEAGKEYLEERQKGIEVFAPEPWQPADADTVEIAPRAGYGMEPERMGKLKVQPRGAFSTGRKVATDVLRSFPLGGEFVKPQGREKAPAAKRTELRKSIFEAVKGKVATRPGPKGEPEVFIKDADDVKDIESEMERFMWEGGEWRDLQKSLEDRYATDDEIDAVSAVWEKVTESIDRAGLTDQLYDRVTAIKDKEKAEKDAEKAAAEAEREKRETPKPARPFQVRKAG